MCRKSSFKKSFSKPDKRRGYNRETFIVVQFKATEKETRSNTRIRGTQGKELQRQSRRWANISLEYLMTRQEESTALLESDSRPRLV